MGEILIYPKRLFDLEVTEIREIIANTCSFALDVLEANIRERINEIEAETGAKIISERTINEAVEAVDNFTETLEEWFDYKMVDHESWETIKNRMSNNYFKALNMKGTLIYAYRHTYKTVERYEYVDDDHIKNKIDLKAGYVISLPLFEAIGETCLRIFDYSILKSSQMKYYARKSKGIDTQRLLSIKNKQSVKYYFVRILRQYDPVSAQGVIRNMDMFGGNEAKALLSMNKLPPTYRQIFKNNL